MDFNFQQVKSTQQTPRGNATLEKYALIQSSSFLCTLSNLPKLTLLGLGGTLQLSDRDYTFFGNLASLRQNILSAIKVMKGRVLSIKNGEEVEQQEDELQYAVCLLL